ncbi:mediator complex subunit 27-domain-containing protein [Phaeosphaeria sp. MPI-PUGE-AT-0046c]|nr:mediator complex subunit 27-domain-containing protein [Phaeosphaeria sp. MPI-PUGE-AT-0046c]
MAAPQVAGDPGAGWDEAQCTAALAQLEQLQAQINDLRLAIPRIIEPFQGPPNARTFKLYAQGVLGSQDGIKALNEQWKDNQTQALFEHTRKSLAASTDLAASVSTPSYGWTERDRKMRDSKTPSDRESVDESILTLTDEDISQALADFQKISLETQDNNRIIVAHFVSGSIKLRFRITIDRDADNKHKLSVECFGNTEPWLSINRCIASRPQPNDFRGVLNMIAAYKTVKATSCAKCKRLLDNLALIPTARRSRQATVANETAGTVWEAFHESCLD